jgi:GT2 family glycosyltransferase
LWGLVYGNFNLLRRELGEQVGWFDERLTTGYGCDNSLCCRVLERGMGVVGVRDARVLHYREQDATRWEHYAVLANRGQNFPDLYASQWELYKNVAKRFDDMQPTELLL